MGDPLSPLYTYLQSTQPPAARPFVTLTYAQSLDGSIAAHANQRLLLSGQESLMMTHRLRALHDGIMVGVGTVLADNPQLTVRLVEGENPRPVVLDTHLRSPLGSNLFQSTTSPIFLHGAAAEAERVERFREAGAALAAVPLDPGEGLQPDAALRELRDHGIHRLMIEGGARVINSFTRADLADLLVLTIAPRLVDGLRPLEAGDALPLPSLHKANWQPLGEDVIFWAKVEHADE
ncbi:MAG: RibD family protein [Anaerolineales bacterium]